MRMPVLIRGLRKDTARSVRGTDMISFVPAKVDGPKDLVDRDVHVGLSRADIAELIGAIPAVEFADAGEDVVTAYRRIRLFLREG